MTLVKKKHGQDTLAMRGKSEKTVKIFTRFFSASAKA